MTKQNWQQFLAGLVALIVLFIVWQVWQLIASSLKSMVPVISWTLLVAGGIILAAVVLGVVASVFVFVRHHHTNAQVKLIEARKLAPTDRGYIGGYVSGKPGREQILMPHVTYSVEVPSSVHIQEDHSTKGGAGASDWRAELEWAKLEWEKEKVAMLTAPKEEVKQIAAPRPTVEAIVEALSDEELEFSTGTSLSTHDLITVPLKGKHIKVIGGSQMGKTSLIGAIIEQMRLKYPPSWLRLAILDLEDMTGLLFEDDPHILEMIVNGQPRKLHARNPEQVAQMLTWLDQVMLYRYELIQQKGLAYVERQPRILIYFEEFLDWKKTLVQRVPDAQLRENAIAAINALSTRGLKVGMHLLVAAQVDYADQDLLSAMAQFVGINLAFCVKPTAARSAGFVDSERLKQNFAAKTPGQYVVEMIGGGDMGVSPEFDVKAKIKAIQAMGHENDEIVDGEVEEMEALNYLPNSSESNLPNSAGKISGRLLEGNGEASGRLSGENVADQALVLKRLMKMQAEGKSFDAMLKAHGLPPGGRNNQDLQKLLGRLDSDEQAANE